MIASDSEKKCEHKNTSKVWPEQCLDCGEVSFGGFSPHQPPVREEWIKDFYQRFVHMSPLNGKDMSNRPLLYDSKLKDVGELVDFIRSERLAAQREVIKMILEKSEDYHEEQWYPYVTVSDIEDIGKGLKGSFDRSKIPRSLCLEIIENSDITKA